MTPVSVAISDTGVGIGASLLSPLQAHKAIKSGKTIRIEGFAVGGDDMQDHVRHAAVGCHDTGTALVQPTDEMQCNTSLLAEKSKNHTIAIRLSAKKNQFLESSLCSAPQGQKQRPDRASF